VQRLTCGSPPSATAVAAQVQSGPFGNRPIVDERMYVEWARRIAGGELLGHDVFFFDPLWAYVLGALLVAAHGSLFACRLFQVALGVGSVELVFRTADRLFGRRTAHLAAWLLALYGPFAFATGFSAQRAADAARGGVARLQPRLGARGAAAAVGRSRPRAGPARAAARQLPRHRAAAGALAAAPLAPRRRLCRAGPRRAALALFGHNLAAGSQWVVTTANGGANFWLGNNPASSGTYEAPDFIVARPSSELSGFKAEAERRWGTR